MTQYQPTCRRCSGEISSAEAISYGSYCEDCYAEYNSRYLPPSHPIGAKLNRSGDGRVRSNNIEKHE